MIDTRQRDSTRDVFFTAWRKHRQHSVLTEMEGLIVEVAVMHPAYHQILEDPTTHRDQDYSLTGDVVNPFLHMGLHVAVLEQVGTDRPEGIAEIYHSLIRRGGDVHAAQHAVMKCLGTWLSTATGGRAVDEQTYVDCLHRLI